MTNLQQIIEEAFEYRAEITPRTAESRLKTAVQEAIALLDSGKMRVAEKI